MKRRKAFLIDRERLIKEVNRREIVWQELSVWLGYKPKTLQQVLSESVVIKRSIYNYNILDKALEFMNMEPTVL